MGIKRTAETIKVTKQKKMKIISQALIAAAAAANSLIQGVEQATCNGELCGTAHGRYAASQVCMRIDEEAVNYYGDKIGAVGSERCMCIYAFRWNQKEGRNFPVVASKTPECAIAYLSLDLNVVEEEANAELATDASTDGRCDDVTKTVNGKSYGK